MKRQQTKQTTIYKYTGISVSPSELADSAVWPDNYDTRYLNSSLKEGPIYICINS